MNLLRFKYLLALLVILIGCGKLPVEPETRLMEDSCPGFPPSIQVVALCPPGSQACPSDTIEVFYYPVDPLIPWPKRTK